MINKAIQLFLKSLTPSSAKKIVNEYKMIQDYQIKRKNLLDNPNKLKQYAKEKEISEKEMKKLLSSNYKNNILKLKELEEKINLPEFQDILSKYGKNSKNLKWTNKNKGGSIIEKDFYNYNPKVI